MAIEITSSKMFSPFFGNSLYVWTSILSITILALTLGYLVGGNLSTKNNPLKILKTTLLASVLFLIINILYSNSILEKMVSFELKIGVIISSFLLIFPLIFCFGIISPIIIRILSSQKDFLFVGQNVGFLYSVSTIGGVIMTFISGFYFIPFIGVRFTLYLVLALLFLATFLSFLIQKVQTGNLQVDEEVNIKESFNPLFRLKIYLVVFIEGAMVIAIELFGSKMIQPILGNSFIVWTLVIGLTITYLTLGYYIGGKLSSKKIEIRKWVAFSFALAAIYMIIMPFFSIELAFLFVLKSLYLGGFILTSILIAPPIILLGLTTPLLIQLLNQKANESGKTSGKIYAISSFGGIFSNLLIGMFILPEWGIVNPLLFFAFVLFITSIFLNVQFKQLLFLIPMAILSLVTYSKFNSFEWESKNLKIQHISEGLMGQLKVFDEYFPIEELEYRFLLINGICQTMIVNHQEVVSTWKYIHRSSRIASLKRNKSALILGLGGGSMASELNKLHIKADLVDIDKRMFELSKKYFFYKDSISKFYDDDARHFINTVNKKYDLIIIDLASGENQPNNIFTKEGLAKITHLLNNDGIIIINFQEHINGNEISAHHSICNTILNLGYQVQYHKTKSKSPDIVTVVSKNHLDLNQIPINQLSSSYPYLGEMQKLIVEPFIEIKTPFKDGIILSDDQPLLDLINAKTIFSWRKDNNRIYAQKHIKLKHPIFY